MHHEDTASDAGTGQLVAGRYRLASVLGEGGMGTVWRALDEVLHREVAVKEVRAPAGLAGEQLARMYTRLEREAWAAARISAPGVVTVHDVVTYDGRPWVVMEFVQGRSLADVIASEGALAPGEVARIGSEVLGALRAAHRSGVLHRDVKPANVLLARDGRVVLTDFGIATVEGDTALTMTGEVIGSPEYLAPERALGREPGSSSDLWSLGALLYTAVQGRSPFRRSSALATLRAVVDDELPPPHRAGPLAPLIEGLMHKDPASRLTPDQAERELRRVHTESLLDTAPPATGSVTSEATAYTPRRPEDGTGPATTVDSPATAGTGSALTVDSPVAGGSGTTSTVGGPVAGGTGSAPTVDSPVAGGSGTTPTLGGPVAAGTGSALTVDSPVAKASGVTSTVDSPVAAPQAGTGTGTGTGTAPVQAPVLAAPAPAPAPAAPAPAPAPGRETGTDSAAPERRTLRPKYLIGAGVAVLVLVAGLVGNALAGGDGDGGTSGDAARNGQAQAASGEAADSAPGAGAQQPVGITVQGTATTYAGTCPPGDGQVPTFTATFTVTQSPIQFSYRWVSTDGAVVDRQWRTLAFREGEPRTRQETVRLSTYARTGTLRSDLAVEIKSPFTAKSDAVPFSLTCTSTDTGTGTGTDTDTGTDTGTPNG